MYVRTLVHLCTCTIVHFYNCTLVPLYPCTLVQFYTCTLVYLLQSAHVGPEQTGASWQRCEPGPLRGLDQLGVTKI